MDTNQKMDRMICEQAPPIPASIAGYAKEKLGDLRSFLKGQSQHSAFRNVQASLLCASSNLPQWKSELAYSRPSIEDYLRQSERRG